MKRIIVYDNVGESYDRFTIIDTKTGDMYGSSSEPFQPNGFGQYCGNLVSSYMNQTYGAIYKKRSVRQIRAIMENQIAIADSDSTWLGVRVKDNKELPKGVQIYIKDITEKDNVQS
jgi:hypothetical protein